MGGTEREREREREIALIEQRGRGGERERAKRAETGGGGGGGEEKEGGRAHAPPEGDALLRHGPALQGPHLPRPAGPCVYDSRAPDSRVATPIRRGVGAKRPASGRNRAAGKPRRHPPLTPHFPFPCCVPVRTVRAAGGVWGGANGAASLRRLWPLRAPVCLRESPLLCAVARVKAARVGRDGNPSTTNPRGMDVVVWMSTRLLSAIVFTRDGRRQSRLETA